MQLTDEQLAEFKRLYRERFGRDISSAEAREKGMSLLRLMHIIYRPMTESELDAITWHKQNKHTKH